MTTRKELVEALRLRYRSAAFSDRIKILDEFVALTCYHRKHAIRVLRGEFSPATVMRLRKRVYGEAVAQALTVLWEAADRVCGKRLKPLIPMLVDAMERHGHLDLDPVIKTKVLQVSAATIDRVLAATRAHIDGQRKRRKGVGSAIRRSIPVRTFADWLDPPPGFFEIDRVEHCGGPKTDGDYVHTLTLTDIATGWTECVAMRVREQMLVIEAFDKVAAELPFPMLGVDSDNDSTFMSQSVFDYCKGHGLVQTHSRAKVIVANQEGFHPRRTGNCLGVIVQRVKGAGPLFPMLQERSNVLGGCDREGTCPAGLVLQLKYAIIVEGVAEDGDHGVMGPYDAQCHHWTARTAGCWWTQPHARCPQRVRGTPRAGAPWQRKAARHFAVARPKPSTPSEKCRLPGVLPGHRWRQSVTARHPAASEVPLQTRASRTGCAHPTIDGSGASPTRASSANAALAAGRRRRQSLLDEGSSAGKRGHQRHVPRTTQCAPAVGC